jgi:hypothetical protein
MPLRVVKDEAEFYEEYRNTLRERARLPIDIDGEHLSHEQKSDIQSALHNLLAAEVIKEAHNELRARGVKEDLLPEDDFPFSLKGLPLPHDEQRILEAKVRQLARLIGRPKGGGAIEGDGPDIDGGRGSARPPRSANEYGVLLQSSHDPGHSCILMGFSVPGVPQNLTSISPLPNPKPGVNFITIAVGLLEFDGFFFGVADFLQLKVEPGAPFGVAPGQMEVGLASDVSWAKEISSWNLVRGRMSSVRQNGPNSSPAFMMLDKGCDGAHTIVFSKPRAPLAIWYDVAHFSDTTLFWALFDGKRLTFTWVAD